MVERQIFSFVPEEPILEWTYQFINKNNIRGNHCHPEFDEYILLISGSGVEIEKNIDIFLKTYVVQNSICKIKFSSKNTNYVWLKFV